MAERTTPPIATSSDDATTRSAALVLDASVALKLVLHERDSDAVARRLEADAADGTPLLVPELFWAEVTHALWLRTRGGGGRGRLTGTEATVRIELLLAFGLCSCPVEPLASVALDIAIATGMSAHDAVYVALADRQDAVVLTCDPRLARRVRASRWRGRVALIP